MYRGGWGRGWRRPWRPDYGPNEPPEPGTAALIMLTAGTKAKVVCITAPPSARQRLIAMGIVPGAEIQVLKNNFLEYGWGPIVIRVNGIELVIGRRIASFIYVKKFSNTNEESSEQ